MRMSIARIEFARKNTRANRVRKDAAKARTGSVPSREEVAGGARGMKPV